MTKTEELLALADEKPTSINDDLYAWATQAAAALREHAATLGTVQKLRPDFLAGYDAGMKDMAHIIDAKIAEQPLAEPVAWMYLYRRHDGTVIRRMKGGRWNGDDAFEQVPLYTHPPAPTTQEPVGCCVHGIHMMNACGKCVPPRGTK